MKCNMNNYSRLLNSVKYLNVDINTFIDYIAEHL